MPPTNPLDSLPPTPWRYDLTTWDVRDRDVLEVALPASRLDDPTAAAVQRLIAAAPEVLAAAEALLERVNDATIAQLRAAVDAARGR